MNDNQLRILEALIKQKINAKIEIANEDFKTTGWNESHANKLARIDGMIDILGMLTGKNYYYNESGLHERK